MSIRRIRSTALALALSTGLMAMPAAQAGVFTGAALADLFVLDIEGPTTGLTFGESVPVPSALALLGLGLGVLGWQRRNLGAVARV